MPTLSQVVLDIDLGFHLGLTAEQDMKAQQ